MSQVSAVRDRKHTALDAPASPFNVDYPDLVESGDVLELLVTSDQSNNTFTATGWTSLARVDGLSGLTAQKYWRTAAGGEAGSTFALSQSSGGDVACIVRAVRGDLNPGTPESATATAGSAPVDPPNLSPSGGNRLYLWTVDGAIRFGGSVITAWVSDLEERIQQVVSGVSVNAWGSERLFTASSYDPASMAATDNTWAAFTTAIPIDAPAAAGFPVVETTSQGSWSSSSTTQTLTLPSGVVAGDLLVATIAGNFNPTISISGWTQVAAAGSADGHVGGAVWQKEADGTEGASVTVDLDPARHGSYICRRISGADATKTEGASNALAASQTVTWADLTPAGGADDILWVADAVNDSSVFLVGWAVNFGALPLSEQDADINTDSTGGGVLARDASTVSPGNGILNTTQDWVSFTAAVYPGATAPSAPTNPAAAALSASVIRVTWDDVTDETGYRVERSLNGTTGWADVSGNLAADTVSYDDTSLTAETQYFYRIFAFNAEGDSPASSTVNATTDAASGNRMGGTGAIRKPPRTPR